MATIIQQLLCRVRGHVWYAIYVRRGNYCMSRRTCDRCGVTS